MAAKFIPLLEQWISCQKSFSPFRRLLNVLRFNINTDDEIVLRVQQLNGDDKLTCLKEITMVGRNLIQSRLTGDLCQDANCGGLAVFLSRVLDNIPERARSVGVAKRVAGNG